MTLLSSEPPDSQFLKYGGHATTLAIMKTRQLYLLLYICDISSLVPPSLVFKCLKCHPITPLTHYTNKYNFTVNNIDALIGLIMKTDI